MATQVVGARVVGTVTETIESRRVCDLRRGDIIILHEGQEDEVCFRVIGSAPQGKRLFSACHINIHCLTMDGRERVLSRLPFDTVRVIQY